jgi:hypothetical protein
MTKRKNKKILFNILLILSIIILFIVASIYPAYLVGQHFFYSYLDKWGKKLIDLEQRGLLSKKFGAAWHDVLKDEAMDKTAKKISKEDSTQKRDTVVVVDGIFVDDYPSLSIISRLNEIRNYSNEIRIVDRKERDIARIRTNHTRAKINEFPPVLIKALVAAEDASFYTNKTGVEYKSIVRSVLNGIWQSLTTFKKISPKGTSTITQQVAKLFISDIDTTGRRIVSKTIDRKIREMRLASAIRKMYKPEEILEVYVNHCVTSDYGLIGYKDIAMGIFNKELKDLSEAECIYLARMVKWGRNIKEKIIKQCEIDMPRMGKALGWNPKKQKSIIAELHNLKFYQPKQIQTDFGHLVDCANEFFKFVLTKINTDPQQIKDMNILDPNSLIRKKGDLYVKLTIDLPLQKELEHLVNARGYGPDRIIQKHGKNILATGQYFSYAIIDSKEGKLLAYYSKDKIGSRLSGLLVNRTPNGSSTAKPIFNALNFDFGIFKPYQKWNDSQEVLEDVPWKRIFCYDKGRPTGVIFANSAVKGKGYEVHNHNNIFEGCQYIFDHLNTSNNILGVETVYRLNMNLFNIDGSIKKEAFPIVQFFYRLQAFERIREEFRLKEITGVRIYKELARIVGAKVDSFRIGNKLICVSDSLYSIALGTLELSLYEQIHLFNILYNNDLIERPAEHPSLFVETIILNGDTIAINDTIKRFHPFSDLNNLRPTYLGLHKRLVSTDGLSDFDITSSYDTSAVLDNVFDYSAYTLDGPVSYIAKSGTTDDILKPFDAPENSNKKTNYGLWNAIIRIDMSRLCEEKCEPEIKDITIACIGECNEKYTGPRDGKTLHKFLTKGLMLKAGIKNPNGFFTKYEQYLKKVTPQDELDCNKSLEKEKLESKNPFEKFLSIFKKKPDNAEKPEEYIDAKESGPHHED